MLFENWQKCSSQTLIFFIEVFGKRKVDLSLLKNKLVYSFMLCSKKLQIEHVFLLIPPEIISFNKKKFSFQFIK